jgi:glycosyltransferase involved in cell wall biosynthesis
VLIGIDASRATGDRITGTERYSREIIAAMIRIATQHRLRLYVRELATPVPFASLPESVGEEVRARIDIVHIHQPRLWTHLGLAGELAAHPPEALFVPAHVLPASFARRRVRCATRSVVTIHDVGHRRFPTAHPMAQRAYLELGTRFSVSHADTVVVDSRATLEDVRRFYGIPERRLCVAYPGLPAVPVVDAVDVAHTLDKFQWIETPFILHVGTLQPRTNLVRLVQAWAVTDRPDGARLVLAGGPGWGGDAEPLHAAAKALGVTDSVHVLGYVSEVEKSVLLRSARAYVCPSLHEGFGFPVLEAQSVDLPVACSNTSSLPEAAGDAALLFDPLAIDAIADALGRLLSDEALRADLIARGRRNLERFSWDHCARMVLDALEG